MSDRTETILLEHSQSVAGRSLPLIVPPASNTDDNDGVNNGSLVLFYQYKEPPWTSVEHKKALKKVIAIARLHNVTGRGRVAPEGLNCTLSSASGSLMRSFIEDLRAYDPILFGETDFKITDDIPSDKLFKSLSVRKTDELVAYGLDQTRAPSLERFAGTHLEAIEYHEAMQDKDAVIIDVRNEYESAIGRFQPPETGAKWLHPRMRHSNEWPAWLANPETTKQLHNKKVLMYCTGGIRCERATALLNCISQVNSNPDDTTSTSNLKPKAVYELQGGIDRYIKTFPQGGFWKGKNYLFDRRQEQVPADKPLEEVEAEISTDTARCVVCDKKWTVYRGKFKCAQSQCGVPVIVCETCAREQQSTTTNAQQPPKLTCQLCKEGYRATPRNAVLTDLVGLKRLADAQLSPDSLKSTTTKKRKLLDDAKVCPGRLFLSRLPLTISKTRLSECWLGRIQTLQWLTDKNSGAFYGSCIVQLPTVEAADIVLAMDVPKIWLGKKYKPKVTLAKIRDGEIVWPPADYKETEFPPVGS